jgi:Protein of unknown function (DUF2442)
MKPPKIIAAQAIDDPCGICKAARTLIIEFSNQEIKRYDISQLLSKPMFAPLQNPGFFKNFSLEPGGYGIVWNAEVDISEYELWKNGESLTEAS